MGQEMLANYFTFDVNGLLVTGKLIVIFIYEYIIIQSFNPIVSEYFFCRIL